jgi:hypothetical protein
MCNLNLSFLKPRLCHLSKTLVPTMALIFWIRGFVVKTRNVAMGSSNNSNVLRRKLSSNNGNRLNSQIIRKSLSLWRDKWLNKNVF